MTLPALILDIQTPHAQTHAEFIGRVGAPTLTWWNRKRSVDATRVEMRVVRTALAKVWCAKGHCILAAGYMLVWGTQGFCNARMVLSNMRLIVHQSCGWRSGALLLPDKSCPSSRQYGVLPAHLLGSLSCPHIADPSTGRLTK